MLQAPPITFNEVVCATFKERDTSELFPAPSEINRNLKVKFRVEA
jgi:hypothetical protein